MDIILSLDPTDRAAAGFAAIGAPQRLGLLLTLVRAGPDGLSIGDLGRRVGMPGSTLSHHLKALTQAGLVGQTRQGRTTTCRANYAAISALSDFLLSECCAEAPLPREGQSHD